MKEIGFKALLCDECVFRRGNVWLLLYVDDVIVISSLRSSGDHVKVELMKHLEMKDLGL